MTLAKLAAQLKCASQKGKSRGRALPSLWLFSDSTYLRDPRAAIRRLPRGAGFVFRNYETPGRETLARELRQLCRRSRIVFLIAGDWRMALRLRADGVHLPEWLAHKGRAIRTTRPGAIVTAAAHTARAMQRARAYGADAVFLSPVFATQSHPGRVPLGPLGFARTARGGLLPAFALGGLSVQTARRLKGGHAAGLAGIGGFVSSPDAPPRAAKSWPLCN